MRRSTESDVCVLCDSGQSVLKFKEILNSNSWLGRKASKKDKKFYRGGHLSDMEVKEMLLASLKAM